MINKYQLLGWVVINGDGECGFLAASGPSPSTWSVWRCSAFIAWTGWTLATTLSHDDSNIKQCPGCYYYYYYYYFYYFYYYYYYYQTWKLKDWETKRRLKITHLDHRIATASALRSTAKTGARTNDTVVHTTKRLHFYRLQAGPIYNEIYATVGIYSTL